ncbi:hypothetical protein MUP77_14925 [Candidatus Bathyarchaeota archaeon]|nr:hypothetical protein [Candidatus Bathyarchaeota archaeon]
MRTWKVVLVVGSLVFVAFVLLVFIITVGMLAISSEWLTPSLIVSFGVLVATATAAFISFRASRPNLDVETSRCWHSVRYTRAKKEIAGTQLAVEFTIKNKGEKTSIYNVGVSCKSTGDPYQTTEKVNGMPSITIGKGNTERYMHNFYIRKRVLEMQLDCTFWLYHTYGKKKVKAKSNLVR